MCKGRIEISRFGGSFSSLLVVVRKLCDAHQCHALCDEQKNDAHVARLTDEQVAEVVGAHGFRFGFDGFHFCGRRHCGVRGGRQGRRGHGGQRFGGRGYCGLRHILGHNGSHRCCRLCRLCLLRHILCHHGNLLLRGLGGFLVRRFLRLCFKNKGIVHNVLAGHHEAQLAAVAAGNGAIVFLRPGVIGRIEDGNVVAGVQAAGFEGRHNAAFADDPLQALAVPEGFLPEAPEGRRQTNLHNVIAVVESPLADFHQCVAKMDFFQRIVVFKGTFADFGDAAGEDYGFDSVLVGLPGRAVRHFSFAGDGQGIIGIGPVDALAAGAAGGRFRANHHRGKDGNQQQRCQKNR